MTDAALECRGLTRSFGPTVAVADLGLVVEPGTVVALVGLNGAGKTTLMRLALGMLRPDAGQVSVLGTPADKAGPKVWARVGHMIETPFAYRELTVRQHLWGAARLHGVPARRAVAVVEAAIDELELTEYADRRCGTLSLGNRQRVGLASALAHRPDLLVLDEPTNALDPAGVVLLRDLVTGLAERGAGVLVSSHHLDEVARVADRIVAVHRGRLLGELDPHTPDLERAFFAAALAADQRRGRAGSRS